VKKQALIAMSGGVDSSMTALLMQQAGYDCIGVHMILQEEPSPDAEGARDIAQRLGMPYYEYDLSERFRDEVIEPFVEGYQAGETPNPCIACNRHLKFAALLKIADELDCQYLATGHYARIEFDESLSRFFPCKSVDESKDQSYVLYMLSQEQLSRVVLPLGNYHKSEIRQMAAEAGFPNANKSDSQDICFIPDGNYPEFIENYLGVPCAEGDMFDTEGRVVGRHRGLIHYTIGQRKGLGAHGRAVFVQSINAKDNSITIGDDVRVLRSDSFLVRDLNWIVPSGVAVGTDAMATATTAVVAGDTTAAAMPCMIKVGYKHTPKAGTVQMTNIDGIEYLKVTFDQPQRAITPGQAAVFYGRGEQSDTVLGGGTIHKVL